MRARRSCLTVPGGEARFHASANETAADEIILDLEDSVAPAAKSAAREAVVRALATYPYRGKTRVVRVNGIATDWHDEDLAAVVPGAADRLDCLMIPKVESADEVRALDATLATLEREAGRTRAIGLELQIETARGLDRVSEIASASPRIETLVLGPGDLAASLGMPVLGIGARPDVMEPFLSRIVVAARANGLQPIDGPYGDLRDLAGLRESARRSALLGCDGKWAIHPSQIDVLNEAFSPSDAEIARAAAILEAFAGGASRLGDEMIDEASRKMAENILAKARAFGMGG